MSLAHMGSVSLLKKIWRRYQAYQRTFRAMRGLLRQHAAEGWEVHSATAFTLPQGRSRLQTPEVWFRATDLNDLQKTRDPVGPENDGHVEQTLRHGDAHVVAWLAQQASGSAPLTRRRETSRVPPTHEMPRDAV